MEYEGCPMCDDALADIPFEEMCEECKEGHIDSIASRRYEEAAYGIDD
jgi:hypothetical protein